MICGVRNREGFSQEENGRDPPAIKRSPMECVIMISHTWYIVYYSYNGGVVRMNDAGMYGTSTIL